VTLGGRRVPVSRPRVRAADGAGELAISAYELFSSTEILGRMAEKMLAGLSTRRYRVGPHVLQLSRRPAFVPKALPRWRLLSIEQREDTQRDLQRLLPDGCGQQREGLVRHSYTGSANTSAETMCGYLTASAEATIVPIE
jgi:hypothetical protein